VQRAIDSAPNHRVRPFVIHIKPEIYREKLTVPSAKGPIHLVGDDAKRTVLTYDDHIHTPGPDGKDVNTFSSASTVILADGFEAEDVTFENSAGPDHDVAIAINVSADRCVFRRCRFLGWQDTLLANRGRQYYEDCHIAGHVDFIFGAATAWFERCELNCRDGGAITAASTPKEQPYGFIFSHCEITAKHSRGQMHRSTLLGRPWGRYASVIYLKTKMARIVAPAGWGDWNDASRRVTVRFAEYRSSGPRGQRSSRVAYAKQLDDSAAAAITPQNVFGDWDPTRQSATFETSE
jgi:pectinesterase